MTEDQWLLARLQVEREHRMVRWRIPQPEEHRAVPQQPTSLIAAVESEHARRRDTWMGTDRARLSR